jgi:hypothetical protein
MAISLKVTLIGRFSIAGDEQKRSRLLDLAPELLEHITDALEPQSED